MPLPWLEDDVIDKLCEPLTQNAARVRFLRSQGLVVTQRPNGRPVVLREAWEAMQRGIEPTQAADPAASRQPPQPNRNGLVLQFNRRGA